MAYPSIIVEADFTTNPLTIPTNWTSLSSRFRSGTIHQGRQRLLDRTEVGRAQAMLDNQDRGLDPTVNPNVRPLNHFRIIAAQGGTQYPLFRGFVRQWPQEWPARKDAVSPVDVEDAFSLLARYELEGQSIGSLATGAHLESVLTIFGWPATGSIPVGKTWWQLGKTGFAELGTNTFLGESLNQFDVGRSTLMATTLTGNLLDHLLNAAETTEGGTFYVSGSGELTFIQRPSPFDSSIGTWGDDPTENRYGDIGMVYDNLQIFNDVRVTRRGDSVPQTATESTGYFGTVNAGKRTLELTDVLFSNLAQTTARADELLAQYKAPHLYPTRLVIRPKADSAVWPTILGLPLMSRVTVRRRPPGGGSKIDLDCLVIGVDYDITPNGWTITWALTPAAQAIEGAWYLGHVGRSELGTTTKLA